jgi:SAM-dependent methyltransferase
MKDFKNKYLNEKESEELLIFDLGSQNIGGTYKSIFNVKKWTYCGVAIDAGDNVDIILRNAYNWEEIESNTVDVLISGQTFEHIEYIWITILEIARILKPGGICCLIAPSSGYEHKYPVDCWRIYPDGMKALAEFAKLEVLETYTQWDDEDYTDGSNVWHDSVLVAMKPKDNQKSKMVFQQFNDRCRDILTEKGQIELYKYQLRQTQADIANLQTKIYQLEYYNQEQQQCIKRMGSSKFWKLRNIYVRVRSFIYK